MKTLSNRGQLIKANLIALVLASVAPYGVYSQDALLEDANQVFNSDQIDIDGDYSQPRVSPADKLEKLRKKLEQKNEDMVNKKIENIRTKNEQKLAKDLQRAFNGGSLSDSVEVSSSAVVKAPAPIIQDSRNNRVIPKFGITNYDGEKNSLESNISFGVNIETDVHPQISVGVSANYSTFDMTDSANYNYNYNNEKVEMSYSHLNLELNSKFYITSGSRIRPYAGAGIGYNRSTLRYTNNDRNYNAYGYYPYSYNNYDNEVDPITSSFVSASGTLGAEMSFSDTVGALIEFKYNKSLTSITNNQNNSSYQNYDERRLEDTNEDIQNSSQFGVNAGIMVKF